MINGSRSEDHYHSNHYVTRDEIRPLNDRLNMIAEEHAAHRVHLKSMDQNLQKISGAMERMAADKAVNKFMAKWGSWAFMVCATMIVAHFTGFLHVLGKLLS